MGLLEMLVGRKLEERDAWKQQKATDESLANAMVAKGNLSPAQLEVIRQIGNKWGSQALMGYYGEALPTARASEQQALKEQQLKGSFIDALSGAGAQQTPVAPMQQMPTSTPQPVRGGQAPGDYGQPVTSELYQPQHPMTPLVAGAIRHGESRGQYDIKQQQGGSAYGAYQFIPSTWVSTSKAFAKEVMGQDVKQLPMTKEYQDAVALWAMDKEMQRSGVPENVARLWYTGNPESKLTRGVGSANSGAAGIPYDVPEYVNQFKQRLAGLQQSAGAPAGTPPSTPSVSTQQVAPSPGLSAQASVPQHPLGALANMPGVTITMPAGGGMGISVDTSKLTPTTQERLARYVASLPPNEQQAYDRALAQKELYGTEPLLMQESVDVRTGQKRLDIYRKSDMTPLGTHYPGVQTQLTPEEQVTQAGAKAGAETFQKGITEMQLSNTPIAQTPGGPTKPWWQVEAERKAEAHKMQAQVGADITKQQNLQPVNNALALLETYSQKVHTGEGAGRILAGVKAFVENMIGQGAGKSYNDYENAFLGVVARVYGAERGVLTDRDVVRAKNLLPSLFAGKEFSEKRFQELRSFINELEGRGMAPPVKAGQYREGHVYPGKDGTFAIYRGPGKWELME